VGTKLSFIDPSQSEIFDLDAHMLITENLKYAEHNEFVDPHEEIIANEQPITMQSIGNIELIQEMLSPQHALELLVIPRRKFINYPWILFQYSNTPHMISLMS
jgi:hypothetical protein